MMLSVIVAVAENGVIGRDGGLPWHLSADLRRFKRLTMGHAILMGRKTWESIGRPLPGRTSIVISRQSDYLPKHKGQPKLDGVFVAANLEEALVQASRAACSQEQAFVIGGARIYEMSLPRADRLFVTRVHADVEGNVWFPEVDWREWQLIEEKRHTADESNEYEHSFQIFERSPR